MPKYIECETLISALESEFEDNENCRLFVSEIPSADVVEVVRCEKCRFACFQYNTDKYPFGVYACKKQPTGRAYKKVKGSHFCSYGELKEREGK